MQTQDADIVDLRQILATTLGEMHRKPKVDVIRARSLTLVNPISHLPVNVMR